MSSESTSHDLLNKFADFWWYEIGVNVIPADTRNKRPIVEWKQFENNPISEKQYNIWKKNNKFSGGLAIIPGKVWHNQFNKGLYLIFIDLDNKKAIEEFCGVFGKSNLVELSELMIVEQHKDEPDKAHVYFYSNHPFTKKSSDRVREFSTKIDSNEVPAIEVKGLGEHGIAYCTPSIHKNGYKYEILGCTEPGEFSYLDEDLDSICKKYNITYLNDNRINALTPIKDLFEEDTKILNGHNRHQELLRVMEWLLCRNSDILTKFQVKSLASDWNQQHCIPPLEEHEFAYAILVSQHGQISKSVPVR